MPIKIICFGKTKTKFIDDGIIEYEKRISKFIKIKWLFIPDVKLSKNITVENVKEKEAEILDKYLSVKDFIIILDEHGKQFDSTTFAQKLDSLLIHHNIVIIIGGVYGFHRSILEKADILLSFSKFTFTHQMIRLILMEQLYRAFTIIKGKKYHY